MKKKQHMTLPQTHTHIVSIRSNGGKKGKKSHVKTKKQKTNKQANKQSHTNTCGTIQVK